MREKLALTIPGYDTIQVPAGVPTGGFTGTGMNVLQAIIQFAFVIGIILVLFLAVWGGILWITSAGDKAKLQAARNRIIYAVLGLFIVLFSIAIIGFVNTFLGVAN